MEFGHAAIRVGGYTLNFSLCWDRLRSAGRSVVGNYSGNDRYSDINTGGVLSTIFITCLGSSSQRQFWKQMVVSWEVISEIINLNKRQAE